MKKEKRKSQTVSINGKVSKHEKIKWKSIE